MVAWVLLVVAILAAVPYLACPVYQFADPRPFSGSALYNPYARLSGAWRTANFHAHGRAWGGLTNGEQSDSDVVARYAAMGYDVAGVSNYESIDWRRSGDSAFIPSYEHGYNLLKAHMLALDARSVEWFDFPVIQSRSQKQYLIDRMKSSAALVVLAHPSLRGAHSVDDMRYLTHYDLLEVLNHFQTSDHLWDVALSSGHPVWAVGDDDTHDVTDAGQTGVRWTMVDAPSTRRDVIIAALKAGRTIAVAGTGGRSEARVTSVTVRGDTLTVVCDTTVRGFAFIGQNGTVLHREDRGGRSASYVIRPSDTYVRTVIATARTTMFLNPVFRYDGVETPVMPVAVFDVGRTWGVRVSVVMSLLLLAVMVAIWPRRLVPVPESEPVAEPSPLPAAQRAS
jgi:hypothetical protein